MEIRVALITESSHSVTDYCLIEYNKNREPSRIFEIGPIIPRPENYAFEAGNQAFQWEETRKRLGKKIDNLKTINSGFKDRHFDFKKLSDEQLIEFRGGFRSARYLASKKETQ